jgi:Flp pilus assembly pilin Flp
MLRGRISSQDRVAGSTYEADQMLQFTKRFARDESGAISIEYVLIAAGISLGIIMVMCSLLAGGGK